MLLKGESCPGLKPQLAACSNLDLRPCKVAMQPRARHASLYVPEMSQASMSMPPQQNHWEKMNSAAKKLVMIVASSNSPGSS